MKHHRRRATAVTLAVALAASLASIPGAVADPPPGTPSSNYDLSELALRNAVYNPGPETISSTGAKAKALLPAMTAAHPDGRYLEVDVTAETAGATVLATWWEAAGYRTSNVVGIGGNSRQVALLDLSAMGDSQGTVKVRIDGTSDGGSTIHRITLRENVDTPPNIVLILVDDMRYDEAELGFYRSLGGDSTLETELVDRGTTFKNFFNTTPLCCPSRASYLTGQYAHNHLVYGNNGSQIPGDNGGILRFYLDDRDETSLGTWMQSAGYETALVGKYLNGYPDRQGLKAMGVTEEYVPDGWDEWYGSFLHDNTSFAPIDFAYDHFRFNENGTVVTYGPGAYLTDVEAALAVDYIDRRAGQNPFFLFLSVYAPHGPTTARPDHKGTHKSAKVKPPTPPSCNESDLSDKPQHIQDIDGLIEYGNCWGPGWQERLDMTLAIDELLDDVIAELEQEGVLDNTYIFFTSDNGLLRGEHQIGGKSAPYEESIRVPLIVRGPGIAEGVVKPHLALNIDLAPTFLDLADGAPTAGSPAIDGESLVGPMLGAVSPDDWRDAILIELRTKGESPNQLHTIPKYFGTRTTDHVYVQYTGGEEELYDLTADPFQLDSIHGSAPGSLKADLRDFIAALRGCEGAACADAARSPDETATSHVDSITVQVKQAKSRAIFKVRVRQENGDLVQGAAVTADWTVAGDLIGEFTKVSNATGRAKFSFLLDSPESGLEFELCVTGIAHADLAYNPAANNETCQTGTWP